MGRLTNTRILVTGGTGFVGSHVVEQLLLHDASVVVSYRSYNPFSYFTTQQLGQQVEMVMVDIKDKERVLDVVSSYEITHIIHLAAQALVPVAYHHPYETLATNIMGTVHLLEAVRLFPHVQGIIVASSDKAYGKIDKDQYYETDRLHGDHPYDVSKSATDLLVQTYVATYGIQAVTTRFGNIYGEGDLNWSRIFPGIMQACISHQPLMIRSNGEYIRDYLYVKDVAQGYLQLLTSLENYSGEAFNFGSHYTVSVLDIIQDIERYLGIEVPYQILNQAKNEIPYQHLNFEKIQSTMGWKPVYELETVLPHMYRWYSDHFARMTKGGIWKTNGNSLQSRQQSGTIFFG